ncbi:8869_t:CDS:2 [Ambispora gerdemannii]|uniref:Dolichol phosphate-mannose biosynthesis regulatory protein n=1 Tax=Ambispora gerdemannii TaxID=144530 RepID=A0A9N8VH69_9GLOM|nr:8869_t:CDS:2 [Ambispora gerdemannii]
MVRISWKRSGRGRDTTNHIGGVIRLLYDMGANNGSPFVDEGHPLHEFFPDRIYAIRIPVVLLLVGLTVVFTFVALVMIKSGKKGVKKAQ